MFSDEDVVKCQFRGSLQLSHKQKEALEKAASYARHFLDGGASDLDRACQSLSDLICKALGPKRTRDKLLEICSLTDLSRDFLCLTVQGLLSLLTSK